jgi:hypothetical protein
MTRKDQKLLHHFTLQILSNDPVVIPSGRLILLLMSESGGYARCNTH